MFDIVLATYITGKHDPPTEEHDVFGIAILCIILFASIAALIVACRRKGMTSSYPLDVLMATFSPLLYWILFAFRCVSH